MRATATSENTILPSRATATAECSSCVWPASSAQLLRGLRAAGRLAEQPLAQAPASDRRRRHNGRDFCDDTKQRLLARQQARDFAGRGKAGILSARRVRRYRRERPRRKCRHWQAAFAARGSARPGSADLFRARWSSRKHHSGSRCRCRSVNSFSTAAAVSSIERRVTSSCAQLNLALSFRA